MEKNIGFFEKLARGLGKTRENLISRVFHADECVDDEFFDELEEAMILSDMGVETTEKLIAALRTRLRQDRTVMRTEAKAALVTLIADAVRPSGALAADSGPAVLLIVGVNGVGKTTSIGKIAHQYRERGRKPMLAAADTFRAAAAEQLSAWAQRANVPLVRHGEGADPAAVVFDAAASYKAKKCDLLIVDTAGRLHTKQNLMQELAKIRRVIARELPDVPCETLLVLDATTGQNAVAQAQAFLEACELTGVILTKIDGSTKGGVVVAVCDKLHLPVRFIGVGEGIDDLQPFDADRFAEAILMGLAE